MRCLAAALLAGSLLVPAGGWAQEAPPGAAVPQSRVCTLRVEPGGETVREGNLMNILDPFRVTCNDGANLRATQGTFDQVARVVTMDGDVYFEDATRSLTSDHAVYDNVAGMLHATGNVVFEDRTQGTTLSGPELEYYRANERRPEALVNAYDRPRLVTRRAPGADGEEPDTAASALTIDADRMAIQGEDDLTAVGNVVIFDEDMRAVADEAEQRGASETLELRGSASIHSSEYSLQGDVIFANVPEGTIQDVEARGNARLLGESLNVDAPRLDLYFEESMLQRSIARSDAAAAPGVQPIASSPTFRLVGDSIDATLPGQQLEMVVAIGNARGESIDTTRTSGAAGAGQPGPEGAAGVLDPMALADSLVAGQEAAGGGEDGLPIDSVVVPGDTAAVPGDTVGGAAEAPASTAALRLVENDWLTGDTITGYFATIVQPPDSAAPDEAEEGEEVEEVEEVEPLTDLDLAVEDSGGGGEGDSTTVLQRLVATGAARSLYHVAPEADDPPGTLPGVNFLSAARIELEFADGQVSVATVEGLRRGLYLEPVAPGEEEDGEAVEDGAEVPEDEVVPAAEDPVEQPGVQPNEEDA